FAFAQGSFGIGDSFRFSADTDLFGENNGGAFGDVPAIFSVVLEGGATASAPFSQINATRSEVTLAVDGSEAVPEPISTIGAGLALLGFGNAARRRKKQQSA
ncbi:MAG: PEP-CTERM sorting domain-containing protein, partial [Cyanobacteria bacterium J06639_1]